MKFQELALINEQMWEPNMGIPSVPGVDPLKDIEFQGAANIGNIVNSLINPVQVAIDSYQLGQTIANAYSQYSEQPSPGNAAALLAVAGLGLITMKTGGGGKISKEAAERIATAKAAADAIRTQADQAKKLAATTRYLEEVKKMLTVKNIDELSKVQNMSPKELGSVLKRASSEVTAGVKDVEKAIEKTPLKTSYDAALERSKDLGKEVPSTQALPEPTTPIASTPPTPSTVTGPTKLRAKQIPPTPGRSTPTGTTLRAKQIPPTPGVKKPLPTTAIPTPTPVRSAADIIKNLEQNFGINLNNKQAVNVLKSIAANPTTTKDFVKKIWSYTPTGMVYNFLTNTSQGRLIAQTIPGVMAGVGTAAAVGTAAGLTAGTQRQEQINKLQASGFTPEQIKQMFPRMMSIPGTEYTITPPSWVSK